MLTDKQNVSRNNAYRRPKAINIHRAHRSPDQNSQKLLMFRMSLVKSNVRGPKKIHEFAAEDQDIDESKVDGLERSMKKTQEELRRATASEVAKKVQVALLKVSSSIQCTQIFMTAYKRLYDLKNSTQHNNDTALIQGAINMLLEIMHDAIIVNIYSTEVSLDVLKGIRKLLHKLQDTSERVSDQPNPMR